MALAFTVTAVQINFRLDYYVRPVKTTATKHSFDVKYAQLEDCRTGFVLLPTQIVDEGRWDLTHVSKLLLKKKN
jgi:hypothetical protein